MVKSAYYLIFFTATIVSFIARAEFTPPSIELLEYLADLENNNGDWVDPLKMDELANNQIKEPLEEKGNE